MKVSAWILTVAVCTSAACGGGNGSEADSAAITEGAAGAPEGTREDPYVGHGFIEEIRDGEILIRHETIPGFMPAMTMAFRVSEDVDLAALGVGDEIMFSIETLQPEVHRVFRVEEAGTGNTPE